MVDHAVRLGRSRSSRFDSHGSRTLTIERDEAPEAGSSSRENTNVGSLRLQGAAQGDEDSLALAHQRRQRRVVWTDDTIDNEGCGKKKSKICCIYHKQRAFDESSSESSVEESEDDEESELEISESDSDTNDDGNVERAHGSGEDRLHRASNRKGGHKHGPGCAGHSPRPNAYERA